MAVTFLFLAMCIPSSEVLLKQQIQDQCTCTATVKYPYSRINLITDYVFQKSTILRFLQEE
ncbi:hypothetical protein BT93_K1375 [Corymbia citriodora subsp. variegata]|nr:hypothetical protein BT93_K1375 [Corymbia citriodora subsp. variegata]